MTLTERKQVRRVIQAYEKALERPRTCTTPRCSHCEAMGKARRLASKAVWPLDLDLFIHAL